VTLILGISTTQGIVLAADSRTGIRSPRSKEKDGCIGHHDYGQKIFSLQNRVAGIAVSGSFNGSHFSLASVIESVSGAYGNNEVNFAAIQDDIHKAIAQRGVAEPTSLLVGYQSGRNCISYWGSTRARNYPIQKEYGFVCQYVVDEFERDEKFKGMDIASAIAYAEGFIDKYRQADDRWRGIGGEVDILVLEPKSRWHKKKTVSDETLKRGELLKLSQAGATGFKVFDGYSEGDVIDALNRL
jgi:hypothetical protein